MNKLIIAVILLLVSIGALSAIHNKSFFGSGNQCGTMNRDRSWKMTEKITEDWFNNSWQQTQKNEYFYNPIYFDRLDSIYTYNWDAADNLLYLAFRTVFTYNSDQEFISTAEYSMVAGGNDLSLLHSLAFYDNQNRLVLYRQNTFSMDTAQWIESDRFHIIYGTDNITQTISWRAGDLDHASQYTISNIENDTQGRMTMITKIVSPDSLNWQNEYQSTTTYHSHDTSTGEEFIDYIAHQFVINVLEGNSTEMGMVTENLTKHWNNSDWINENKSTSTYNDSDKLTEELDQYWDNSIWNNDYKYSYAYDANGNMQQQIYQQNSSQNTWINANRYTFNWSQITANNDNVSPATNSLALTSFPNPFNPTTTISYNLPIKGITELSVYNIKGQLVKTLINENQIAGQHSVTWNGKDDNGNVVTSGLYFCKISSAGKQETRKMMLVK